MEVFTYRLDKRKRRTQKDFAMKRSIKLRFLWKSSLIVKILKKT